jgi:hypothetical protein
MDMEFGQLRTYLIQEFQEWAYEQRNLYLPKARPLSDEERSRLAGYFERRILDLTKVASVDRISNPDFYDDLPKLGMPIPLDFSQAAGFTLIDCVLIHKSLVFSFSSWISTLFHEMVHVVQFDILGPGKLIELYIDNLFRNKYQDVLFERQAYTLAERFIKGEPPFSVSEAIKQEIGY